MNEKPNEKLLLENKEMAIKFLENLPTLDQYELYAKIAYKFSPFLLEISKIDVSLLYKVQRSLTSASEHNLEATKNAALFSMVRCALISASKDNLEAAKIVFSSDNLYSVINPSSQYSGSTEDIEQLCKGHMHLEEKVTSKEGMAPSFKEAFKKNKSEMDEAKIILSTQPKTPAEYEKYTSLADKYIYFPYTESSINVEYLLEAGRNNEKARNLILRDRRLCHRLNEKLGDLWLLFEEKVCPQYVYFAPNCIDIPEVRQYIKGDLLIEAAQNRAEKEAIFQSQELCEFLGKEKVSLLIASYGETVGPMNQWCKFATERAYTVRALPASSKPHSAGRLPSFSFSLPSPSKPTLEVERDEIKLPRATWTTSFS